MKTSKLVLEMVVEIMNSKTFEELRENREKYAKRIIEESKTRDEFKNNNEMLQALYDSTYKIILES